MASQEEDTMTPQERRLIDDLFDRLAALEAKPRDSEAEKAIIDGLRRAPNAAYALVQTVLVQDEALKRANDRIEQLEAGGAAPQPAGSGSFLDTMRDAVFGGGRGSVPSVNPNAPTGRPVWNSGQVAGAAAGADPRGYGADPRGGFGGGFGGFGGQQAPGSGGSSFLGTAAAAAAGVIGGSMLMSSIRGLMGGGGHQSFGDAGGLGGGGGPWGGSDASGGDLARQAGLEDIGRGGGGNDRGFFGGDDQGRGQGLFDTAGRGDDPSPGDDDGFGADDFGGDGDSDYA
jgi:hypothetical protein